MFIPWHLLFQGRKNQRRTNLFVQSRPGQQWLERDVLSFVAFNDFLIFATFSAFAYLAYV